jgi:hypothetical protein
MRLIRDRHPLWEEDVPTKARLIQAPEGKVIQHLAGDIRRRGCSSPQTWTTEYSGGGSLGQDWENSTTPFLGRGNEPSK